MPALRPLMGCLIVGICLAVIPSLVARDSKTQQKSYAAFEDDDEDNAEAKRFATKLETKFVGDYTSYAGLEPVVLEGVGLVVGLNGTGGEPAPSSFRTALMEELKKNGLPNPNAVLKSPNTALVLVRAKLPALLGKGEKIDVEVRVPDSAEATSLAGGWLMEVYLTEQAFVPGRGVLKGHAYAKAEGAVLTSAVGSDATKTPALLKRGRVLGGATVLKERELALYLRHDFRSIRNTTRIAEEIGRRFHHFDRQGIKKPMAEAKTDQKIVLSVHPKYKDNYPRYLQVLRHMAFEEKNVATRVRIQKLQEELFVPEKADETALQLEAIGVDAVPILKHGLTSPLIECRFHSAIALAYLGNSEGLPTLVEAARDERSFRVFALAAISTLEDAEAHLALRGLMNEATSETRYGAFRALWTLDKQDPFIRGETLGMPKDSDQRSKRNLGEYKLHTLDSLGEPMVHVTLRTRPEVVVFGSDQELRPPLFLAAGRNIMVTAQPGATSISLAKFAVGQADERREVSLRLADVIRAADEMGATYPDVVQMLADASKQKNLATRLAADELPESGRVYYRPDGESSKPGSKKGTKVGRDNNAPNLFPEPEKDDSDMRLAREKSDQQTSSETGNMANVPQDADAEDHTKTKSNSPKTAITKKEAGTKTKRNFSWVGGVKK